MLKLVKLLENVEQNPSKILRKRWWIQMFVWTSLCSSISILCRLCTAQEALLLRPFYLSLYLYLSSSLSLYLYLYFLSLYLYLMQSADIVHGTFLSRPLITVFCPRTSTQHITMVIMITTMKMFWEAIPEKNHKAIDIFRALPIWWLWWWWHGLWQHCLSFDYRYCLLSVPLCWLSSSAP